VESSTAALWVAAASLLATAITLFFTNRREAKLQEYEQERQEREIEERRWATLREERLRAYSTFAKLTKIVDAKNPSPQAALGARMGVHAAEDRRRRRGPVRHSGVQKNKGSVGRA